MDCNCTSCSPSEKAMDIIDWSNVRAVQAGIRPCFATNASGAKNIKGCVSIQRNEFTFVVRKDNAALVSRLMNPAEISRMELRQIFGYLTPDEGQQGLFVHVAWIIAPGMALFRETIDLEKWDMLAFVARANALYELFGQLTVEHMFDFCMNIATGQSYAFCMQLQLPTHLGTVIVLSDHFIEEHAGDTTFCTSCEVRYDPGSCPVFGWEVLRLMWQHYKKPAAIGVAKITTAEAA
jgi:hypothetical protein